MPEISIGVIGCGNWGKNLMRNFHNLGALSAICDKSWEQLEPMSKTYPSVHDYGSVKFLLNSGVDAVAIATPVATHYEIVRDAFERLKNERDAHSRKLEIYKLQSASPRMITKGESEGVDIVRGTKPRQEGDPLGSSYINFFIANGGIIVPAYDDEHDMLAIEILSWAFPDRKVVSVPDAREISLGGGNIHCITQQQPNC